MKVAVASRITKVKQAHQSHDEVNKITAYTSEATGCLTDSMDKRHYYVQYHGRPRCFSL